MALLIALFTIIFICVGFVPNQYVAQSLDPFSSYLLNELNFIKENSFVFILGFFILTIFCLRSLHFDKKYKFHKKFLFSASYVLTTGVFGFVFSFFILFLIGILQLNILSITANTDRNSLGIISSRKEIANALKTDFTPPEILTTDKDQHKELLAIASATSGTANFYGGSILQSIPSFLVIPLAMDKSSILLLDNTLIVSEINTSDMQTLSPIIGYVLVKNYFPLRKIKSYPKVSIMGKQEYNEFRKKETAIKIAKADEEINNLDNKISSLSAALESDKDLLAETQNNKNQKAGKQIVNSDDLTSKIQKEQSTLLQNKYYENFYKSQKKLLQIQDENTPHESGVFVPNDLIKIVKTTKNPHAIADYFATLTHEYLHYASYVSDSRTLRDSFFEEGLTEYFARMIIKNDLNTSTNLGYPVQAKIISEMTNIIPESEFADIYFSKDQDALERALNRVYGDDFYKNTQITFNSLQYASTPTQVLKLANEVMKKIGAPDLTEKDLVSSYSKL